MCASLASRIASAGMMDRGPGKSGNCLSCSFKTLAPFEEYACDAYTGGIILIVGFITSNYILKEFIFEEKRLNEISENKFFSKITRYTVVVCGWICENRSYMHNHKYFEIHFNSLHDP